MSRDLFGHYAAEAPEGIVPPPRAGQYRTIYADAPWLERGSGQIKRGADRHYDLMSTDAIAALPVGAWAAPDAHLYMWVTNNFLPDGLRVMQAWGFRYVTKIEWFKSVDGHDDILTDEQCDAADADLQFGIGQYYRGCTEPCLFGVRGRLPYRMLPNGKRAQGRTGFHARRGEHSAKPEKMRRMIERVSHGPYLELFARRAVAGWDVWGHQAPEAA